MRVTLLALAFVAVSTEAAQAQTRTSRQILETLIFMIVVADACDLTLTPTERQRLAAAGERMQVKAGATDDEMERLVSDFAAGVSPSACREAAPRFASTLLQVLDEAEKAP